MSERLSFVTGGWWRAVKRLNVVIREESVVRRGFLIRDAVYTKAEEEELTQSNTQTLRSSHSYLYGIYTFRTTLLLIEAQPGKRAWLSVLRRWRVCKRLKRQSVRGGVVWREVGVWKTNLPKSGWGVLCAKLSLTEILLTIKYVLIIPKPIKYSSCPSIQNCTPPLPLLSVFILHFSSSSFQLFHHFWLFPGFQLILYILTTKFSRPYFFWVCILAIFTVKVHSECLCSYFSYLCSKYA